MGLIRFLVPRRDRIASEIIERAYFSGLDEIPYQARTQWTDEGLAVQRVESDSGNFHLPWRVEGHGEAMLSTSSLMDRERPYHLQVELARGTLTRIRNQIALLELAECAMPPRAAARLVNAQEHLARAATGQHDLEQAADAAEQSLTAAFDVVQELGAVFVEQAVVVRHRPAVRGNTVLGVNLGYSPLKKPVGQQLVSTFNAGAIPFPWRDIEAREGERDWSLSDRQLDWCRQHGLKICGGPLLQLEPHYVPDWLYLWEEDEENLQAFALGFIREIVDRYRGKVHLWNCAARFNVSDTFSRSEEARLRLVATVIEATRQADPRTPLIVTIDQPWGRFMSNRPCDLSPMHFADMLVRTDLGLAGIGLEINFGYEPEGTDPREPVDFSQQLDRWSGLGLPLLVTLTVPSATTDDPQARRASKPIAYPADGRLSGESQQAWVERFVPLLLSKPAVQGIIWNQLLDSQPHDFPHGGLFAPDDEAKPAIAALAEINRRYLS